MACRDQNLAQLDHLVPLHLDPELGAPAPSGSTLAHRSQRRCAGPPLMRPLPHILPDITRGGRVNFGSENSGRYHCLPPVPTRFPSRTNGYGKRIMSCYVKTTSINGLRLNSQDKVGTCGETQTTMTSKTRRTSMTTARTTTSKTMKNSVREADADGRYDVSLFLRSRVQRGSG